MEVLNLLFPACPEKKDSSLLGQPQCCMAELQQGKESESEHFIQPGGNCLTLNHPGKPVFVTLKVTWSSSSASFVGKV